MLHILTLVVFLRLFFAMMSMEVTSYARISKNGQLANFYEPSSWIARPPARNNTTVENENRSINDIVITISPMYIPPKILKLQKGETVDHAATSKYSTLDHEIITKLDATAVKKRIQERFHPPAIFEHSIANGRPQKGAIDMSNTEISPNVNLSTYSNPIFSSMYEYSPPEFIDNESPISKKPIISKYPVISTNADKIPDSYKLPPNKYHTSDEADYSSFDIASSYENDGLKPKPMKHVNHHGHPPLLVEDSYEHDHHDFHHDVIYDHIPEYHEHHREPTTEEPEMNDQRLDKRPYSYYFIGKKLWYIPLYFSIYFIIYIAALVLKSIARHKINFPAHLAETATHQKRSESSEGWWNSAERIIEGIERFAETFGKYSTYRMNHR